MQSLASQLAVALQQVQTTAQEYADALVIPAQLLCGLFALIYIGVKLGASWGRGEKIDFYALLRPFSVGLIIVFFSAFVSLLQLVVTPIEMAATALNESVYEPYVQSQNNYLQAVQNVKNSMAVYERKAVQNETQIVEEVMDASMSEEQPLFRQSITYLAQLTQVGVSGMVYFMQVYVVLAQLVLLLVGPFAFALSLLPGFSANITHWMLHFVRLSMYRPLCHVVGFMVAVLFATCVFPVFEQQLNLLPASEYTFSDHELAQHIQFSIQLIFVLFNSIAIALYACIPAFSKWIVGRSGISTWLVSSKK